MKMCWAFFASTKHRPRFYTIERDPCILHQQRRGPIPQRQTVLHRADADRAFLCPNRNKRAVTVDTFALPNQNERNGCQGRCIVFDWTLFTTERIETAPRLQRRRQHLFSERSIPALCGGGTHSIPNTYAKRGGILLLSRTKWQVLAFASAIGRVDSKSKQYSLEKTNHQEQQRHQSEWTAFALTGRSNGRAMQYIRMCIPPSCSFPLHAHPNVECIYVVHGTLYEKRLVWTHSHDDDPMHELVGDDDDTNGVGRLLNPSVTEYPLDLSQYPESLFVSRSFGQGQVLLNEIGSIHRSYTQEDGAELFVLWGQAGHCNVPVAFTPPSQRV